MKMFTRICLAVCLVFAGIGALFIGAGIALGSGFQEVQQMADAGELSIGSRYMGSHVFGDASDENAGNVQKGDLWETFEPEEISNFDMDIQYGEIRFSASTTDKVEVSIQAPKSNSYSCKNDDGTLKIKDKTHHYHWGFGNREVIIEVAIPEGKVFEKVKIKTDAGKVDINYAFHAENIDLDLGAGEMTADAFAAEEKLSVEVGAGNLEIAEFSAEKLTIDCGVGRADLKGTVTEKAEADCGVGNLNLTLLGKEDDYNYEVNCGIGEVRINAESYSGLSEEKDIDNGADRDIRLDCGVGQLTVKTLEWEELNNGTEKTI